MLLPQSSAFAALKNRLNSVSAIGLLHAGPRAYVSPKNASSTSSSSTLDLYHSRKRSTETHPPVSGFNSPITSSGAPSAYERPTGRLKTREENVIRWVDLLEKFKSVQEKSRRSHLSAQRIDDDGNHSQHPSLAVAVAASQNHGKERSSDPKMGAGGGTGAGGGAGTPTSAEAGIGGSQKPAPNPAPVQKSKSGLGNFGRLTSGIGPRKSKR